MPFCPKCRYEYRPGIEKCPDCDMKLVDKLPEEPQNDLDSVDLVQIASFPTAVEAHDVRLLFEGNGIAAVVSNDVMSSINPVYVIADGGVKLYVREPDAKRAAEILEGH